jgi:ABC-type Zn uptake system ZnuABC Zn-binding protein ZnuA
VIAVESFLADITKNVAGDRAVVEALIPTDVDPHTFEATPGDVRRIADADVVVINGAGLEVAFELTIHAAASRVVVASEGLEGRHAAGAGDPSGAADAADPARRDPHFWLDPLQVVAYADNIAAGLTDADPAGAESYAANAATYQAALRRLDDEIRGAVAVIPVDQRKLVTDHEELGYYADRYGFRVIGAVVPSLSPEAQASARDLAALIDRIRTENVRAIFVERGANPQMAAQVASETGVRVVADLYTHSLSAPDGPAPTYAAMLRYDTSIIVDALAGGP